MWDYKTGILLLLSNFKKMKMIKLLFPAHCLTAESKIFYNIFYNKCIC